MLGAVSWMPKGELNCYLMTSDIPCKSPCCSSAVHLLHRVFSCFWLSIWASIRSLRGSFGTLPNMSAEFPPPACARAELCFYENDCRRLSAAVWSRRRVRLLEAVAAPYWSYLFGWTMTSVRRRRCRLRQHLGELGCNRGRGSPIKSSLVDLTLNQYKKKSQFRHLPVRSWPQKRQNPKNVLLAATHF